ncbi:hypothetical protein [Actinomadura montaniterrae]|uniref:Uncharacterized protein n=1 Tax=Actinomadura montaniterrae TaxID=1803903 RepID=A0A6L3VIN4_9ACTN|nr:hypothetical protein [Actinomadura montaniterrae]KAB2365375.1 hypothetical protein F9B16_40785 [Actinomadura montaniterrae]
MPTLATTEAEIALGHLERLTEELRSRGWTVELAPPSDRWPSALVANPEMRMFNENVIAVQERSDDSWSYFYSWGERIAPCTDPSAAAALLGRVLATRRDN